jgi:hypothetical protein
MRSLVFYVGDEEIRERVILMLESLGYGNGVTSLYGDAIRLDLDKGHFTICNAGAYLEAGLPVFSIMNNRSRDNLPKTRLLRLGDGRVAEIDDVLGTVTVGCTTLTKEESEAIVRNLPGKRSDTSPK